MSPETLLVLERVSFAYPVSAGRRPFALSDISLDLGVGEVVGVIGPNSSGKTTLIRLLTRMLEPASGEIRLDGVPVRRLARTDLARRVGVVAQSVPLECPFNVGELVLMGRYPHGPGRYFESRQDHAAARAAMQATGVLELAELPLDRLSGGERQRAFIARALAQEPRVLVLDEPTAHLDLRYQVEVASLLRRLNRERGIAILLVSHDLNLAGEVCDRLVLLAGGLVAATGPPEVVLEKSLLSSVFGCEVIVDNGEPGRRPLVRLTFPR